MARQRERDKKIEDALTAAFDRLGDVRASMLAMVAADRELAAAVAVLAELGEKPEAIAAAIELSLKEVQRLLKLAEETRAGGDADTPPAAGPQSVAAVPAALVG